MGALPQVLKQIAVQSGALSYRQCLATGLTREAVRSNLRAGRWQRRYRGVLIVHNGPIARITAMWAALLYAGRGAILSHHTAAELWGLTEPHERRRNPDEAATDPPIQVMVRRNRRIVPQPGLVLHYSDRAAADLHPARMPPMTRLEVTVLDLVESAGSLLDAVGWTSRALRSRRTTPDRLTEALESRPRQHWRRELKLMLTDDAVGGVHSPLEWLYLHRVERAHGLPVARRQRHRNVGGNTQWLDNIYEDFGLIVELDGRLGHENDPFRDRERDNASVVEGAGTLRYGWPETLGDSCGIAAQVAKVLTLNGWTGEVRSCGERCALRQ